jgi:hypothetical protein
MRTALLLLVCACSSKPTGADSPVAAARCEAAAIRARSVAQLKQCLLPVIRDAAEHEGAKIEWDKLGDAAAKLEAATEKDFTIEPTPEGKSEYGDKVASLPLGHDSLEVVHAKDGSWYIVDTGI